MQLKNIKGRVSLATCSLLQVAAPVAHAAESEWDIDTAILYYGENNNRVQLAEPAIYLGHDLGDDERVDIRFVVDVLTGATPNGAHSTSVSQTFTTPSGNGSYTTAADDLPLDDTFRDTRFALAGYWTMPIDRMSKIILGGNVSAEYDYISAGVSANYTRDFNNRNTTLTAGLAFNNDVLNPVGGVPTAFAPMVSEGEKLNRTGTDETKLLSDLIIGVTQVVNRKTIFQLNYAFGMVDGYQTDPYKILTVLDPVTGLPVTASSSSYFDTSVTGNLPYVYEKRPDSRQRNNIYFTSAHHLTEDVIHFSYRYFWDDWGVTSNTFDLRYRYQLGSSYLVPHLRYYQQSAADFYTHNMVLGTDIDATTGAVTKDYASNDYRLSEMTTTTVGLKYGIPLSKTSEISMRGESMTQTVDNSGIPAGEETPDLKAVILQLNYSLVW